MRVLDHRRDRGGRRRAVRAAARGPAMVVAFALRIAVVAVAAVACGAPIDLLPCPFADVADPEITVRAVDAETPGVAEAMQPDFAAAVRVGGVGIAGRNRIRRGLSGRRPAHVRGSRRARRAHVEAQDLAHQGVGLAADRLLPQILRQILGIERTGARSRAPVEQPVRPEMDVAAVVVVEQRHAHDLGFAACEHVGRGIARNQAYEPLAAGAGRGVDDVERAVGGEVRIEREAEQAALDVPGVDRTRVVRRCLQRAVDDDADGAAALDHEHPATAVMGAAHREWLVESRRDVGHECDVAARAGGRRGAGKRGDEPRRETKCERTIGEHGGTVGPLLAGLAPAWSPARPAPAVAGASRAAGGEPANASARRAGTQRSRRSGSGS